MSRARVLVIDDEELVGRAIERTLRDYDVVYIADAEEALRALREQRFDVVICDLSMPNLSGAALLAEALLIDPSIKDRFIFVSGSASRPPGLDVADYLTKPFESSELREAVATVLDDVALRKAFVEHARDRSPST